MRSNATCSGPLTGFAPAMEPPAPFTLQQALDEAREFSERTRPGGRHTYASHARTLAQALPQKPLADITKRDVLVWMAESKNAGHAASTVNHRLAFLRCAFDLAVDAGHVNHNPARDVKRQKVQNEITRDFTRDEEERLRLFLPNPETWNIVRFALLTGMRRAEQFRLTVADVDFARKGVRIKGSKGTRWRWVPLTDEGLEIARECAEKALALTGDLQSYLFVPDRTGCPLEAGRRVYAHFHAAVQEAGLPRTRWHDLRHAFASRIVQKGKSLYTLQTLLGHTDPKMTMRYSHLQDDQLRDAVSVL